jgi:hypothetical protein
MEQLLVEVPEGLVKKLEAYKGNLGEVLAMGLRQIKMQQALVLFKEAGVSLWKAAHIAGVFLREMTLYAVSQGLRAICYDKTLEEEPMCEGSAFENLSGTSFIPHLPLYMCSISEAPTKKG